MPKVFISYRRADSAATTGRIYDRVAARFGKRNVYIDVDSLPAGVDFKVRLDELLKECDAQLVVIGKSWLDVTNDQGQRRLDNPEDVVRQEVEAGLNRGIPLIPLLVDGATPPKSEELPESLAKLPDMNGLPVRNDRDFDGHVRRVITETEKLVRAYNVTRARELKLRGWRYELRLLRRAGLRVFAVLGILLAAAVLTTTALAVPYAIQLINLANAPQYTFHVPSMESNSIAMVSAQEGWAVGENGTIWHYTQAPGQSKSDWFEVSSPVTSNLTSVAMASASEGWAVGTGGVVLHYRLAPGSSGSGVGTWAKVTSPTSKDLSGVAMESATEGWAVGAAGTLLHLHGGTWVAVKGVTTCNLSAISFASPTVGWAVGIGSCLVQYNGTTWQPVSRFLQNDLSSIMLISIDEGWAVGDNGNAVHYVAGLPSALDWSDDTLNDALSFRNVYLISRGEGWAVGDKGVIAHYIGGEWLVAGTSPTTVTLTGVVLVTASDGWAFGSNGTILRYHNGTWSLYRTNT